MHAIKTNAETIIVISFSIRICFASITDTALKTVASEPNIKLGTPKYAINTISPKVVPSFWSSVAVR